MKEETNIRSLLIPVLLMVVAIVGFSLWVIDTGAKTLTEKMLREKYADDPVMLYQKVGIIDCVNDQVIYKGNNSGAVRVLREDLERARIFFGERWNGVVEVLYTNAPSKQPALMALKIVDGKYCSHLFSGSYSVRIFLELKEIYQSQIE